MGWCMPAHARTLLRTCMRCKHACMHACVHTPTRNRVRTQTSAATAGDPRRPELEVPYVARSAPKVAEGDKLTGQDTSKEISLLILSGLGALSIFAHASVGAVVAGGRSCTCTVAEGRQLCAGGRRRAQRELYVPPPRNTHASQAKWAAWLALFGVCSFVAQANTQADVKQLITCSM